MPVKPFHLFRVLGEVVVAVPAAGGAFDPEELLVLDRNVVEDLVDAAGLGQRVVVDLREVSFRYSFLFWQNVLASRR